MPIAKTDDIINRFIMGIYDAGRKIGCIEAELGANGHIMYDHTRVVPGALKRLAQAGFEIVRKGEPATAAVAPVMGRVAVLTPDGERIVQAIAAGDFTGISNADFNAFQGIRASVIRADEIADQAGRVTELTAGIIKAPKGEPA